MIEVSTQPPGVVVLGMHRSGTSAATRLVNMLGLATCRADDMVRGAWNPSGHWESRTLVKLDDKLLAEMGRTWWYPPPTGDSYFDLAAGITTSAAKAARVFGRAHRERPWVWKDPRACLLLPFWRAALGARVLGVLIVRNPLEVAVSLERRHDVPLQFGLALWERYNRLLLEHAKGMPVLVSRYDDLIADPAGWCERTGEFLGEMGLSVQSPAHEGDSGEFVDPQSRHSVHTRSEVAAKAPHALAMLDALERMVGPHPSFQAPDLAPEAPSVDAELMLVGPETKLTWRPPPWARKERSSAGDPGHASRRSPHLRKLGRLVRGGPIARWRRW